MAKFQTDTLKTADGLALYTASWIPETVKAVVVLVHGYGEHSGRYAHVVEALTQQNYAVYTIDHRGHGKSEGVSAYIKSIYQVVDDLKFYVDRVQAQHPDQKLFMLGHSMGALISLAYALRYQAQLSGLIISGIPLSAEDGAPAWLAQVARVVNVFAPKLPLAEGISSDALSRDPAVAQAYEADPLNYHGKMRVGTALSIVNGAKQSIPHLERLKLPVLILHGAEDKICPPSGSDIVYEKAASTDKQLIKYDGLRHEIMNEPERATVLGDITAWLEKHIAEKPNVG